jgi:hypothetical protein
MHEYYQMAGIAGLCIAAGWVAAYVLGLGWMMARWAIKTGYLKRSQ